MSKVEIEVEGRQSSFCPPLIGKEGVLIRSPVPIMSTIQPRQDDQHEIHPVKREKLQSCIVWLETFAWPAFAGLLLRRGLSPRGLRTWYWRLLQFSSMPFPPTHVKYAEKGQPSSLRSLWPTQRDPPNQRESMTEQMVLVVEGVQRL